MTPGGREQFHAFVQDVWAGFLWLTELRPTDTSSEQLIARLDDELAIRQHLFSYTDAFDSKDLRRIVGHFHEEAVLITNRGTFPRRDGIEGYYQPTTLQNRLSYHRVQNVCVRVTEPGHEAWVAVYFHALFAGAAAEARSQYGRYFGRLTADEGRWRFADWRISVDENRMYPKG